MYLIAIIISVFLFIVVLLISGVFMWRDPQYNGPAQMHEQARCDRDFRVVLCSFTDREAKALSTHVIVPDKTYLIRSDTPETASASADEYQTVNSIEDLVKLETAPDTIIIIANTIGADIHQIEDILQMMLQDKDRHVVLPITSPRGGIPIEEMPDCRFIAFRVKHFHKKCLRWKLSERLAYCSC